MAFSFTGAFIACRPLATSGTPAQGYSPHFLANRHLRLEKLVVLCYGARLQDDHLAHSRPGGYCQQKRRAASEHRPAPDGTIPEPEEETLLEIGRWLAVNGEAIYGTRPWKVYGEGPTEVFEGYFQDTKRAGFTAKDVRFTTKGDTLYAIVMGWPESGETVIQSLGTGLALYPDAIKEVELLGCEEGVQWSRDADGLKVRLPSQKPAYAAFVLKVTKK